MGKIKEGSKVRLQKIPSYLRGIKDGDEGVVVDISDEFDQPYEVKFKNGEERTFSARELIVIDQIS